MRNFQAECGGNCAPTDPRVKRTSALVLLLLMRCKSTRQCFYLYLCCCSLCVCCSKVSIVRGVTFCVISFSLLSALEDIRCESAATERGKAVIKPGKAQKTTNTYGTNQTLVSPSVCHLVRAVGLRPHTALAALRLAGG